MVSSPLFVAGEVFAGRQATSFGRFQSCLVVLVGFLRTAGVLGFLPLKIAEKLTVPREWASPVAKGSSASWISMDSILINFCRSHREEDQ